MKLQRKMNRKNKENGRANYRKMGKGNLKAQGKWKGK
jgi:hypothetical protein